MPELLVLAKINCADIKQTDYMLNSIINLKIVLEVEARADNVRGCDCRFIFEEKGDFQLSRFVCI